MKILMYGLEVYIGNLAQLVLSLYVCVYGCARVSAFPEGNNAGFNKQPEYGTPTSLLLARCWAIRTIYNLEQSGLYYIAKHFLILL